MGRMKEEAIRQAMGSYESVLFRWVEGAQGRSLMPFALHAHGTAAAARAAASSAVPGVADGAIAARLDAGEDPFAPPRQTVLARIGQVPAHV